MSGFPSVEADELVTKQFLRTELAELRSEWRSELGDLRSEMADQFHQQTVWFGGALGAATAVLAAIGIFA